MNNLFNSSFACLLSVFLFSVTTPSLAAQKKGFVFMESPDSVVSMEAEQFYDYSAVEGASWIVIPHYGKTRSAITLFPTTIHPAGSTLKYRMKINTDVIEVKAHLFLAPTLNYEGNEGLFYTLSFDGATPTKVNMNGNVSNWEISNWQKNRINEKITLLQLPKTIDNVHTLTIEPLSPGIVIQKIVIDCGGLKYSYLGPPVSSYSIEDK